MGLINSKTSKMIENIKKLWDMMTSETKKKAEDAAMGEFGLESSVAFRQNWLYKGKVPEQNLDRLHEIFLNAMKLQHENQGKMLGV